MKKSLRKRLNQNWLLKFIIISTFILISITLLTLYSIPKIQERKIELYHAKDSLYKAELDKENKEVREYQKEQKKKGDNNWYYVDEDKFNEKFDKNFESKISSIKFGYIFGGGSLIIVFSILLYIFLPRQQIYCPHCYMTVLRKSIVPFTCPFCKSKNESFGSIYTSCINKDCNSIIPAIPCPHCGEQIDLLAEYDLKKILEKRYGKKTKV